MVILRGIIFLWLFNDIKGVFVLFVIQQALHLDESTAKQPCSTVVYPQHRNVKLWILQCHGNFFNIFYIFKTRVGTLFNCNLVTLLRYSWPLWIPCQRYTARVRTRINIHCEKEQQTQVIFFILFYVKYKCYILI